jgi:hypothetical protein
MHGQVLSPPVTGKPKGCGVACRFGVAFDLLPRERLLSRFRREKAAREKVPSGFHRVALP